MHLIVVLITSLHLVWFRLVSDEVLHLIVIVLASVQLVCLGRMIV